MISKIFLWERLFAAETIFYIFVLLHSSVEGGNVTIHVDIEVSTLWAWFLLPGTIYTLHVSLQTFGMLKHFLTVITVVAVSVIVGLGIMLVKVFVFSLTQLAIS